MVALKVLGFAEAKFMELLAIRSKIKIAQDAS